MMNSQVYDKAYQFAIRVVNAYKHLCEEKKEFVLSKQLLRSGITSVSSYQLPVTKLFWILDLRF